MDGKPEKKGEIDLFTNPFIDIQKRKEHVLESVEEFSNFVGLSLSRVIILMIIVIATFQSIAHTLRKKQI